MDREGIENLGRSLSVDNECGHPEVEETHISWIILTGDRAYKIKKPRRYNFLDFSSMDKRRFYCRREVELNRRFSSGVYLGVHAIIKGADGSLKLAGEDHPEAVEYCVCMKRLESGKRMDLLIKKGEVNPENMRQLAGQVAAFHREAEHPPAFPSEKQFRDDFNDLLSVNDRLESLFGAKATTRVREAVSWSDDFLKKAYGRLSERNQMGFFIDGHGDLHCRNIFLTTPPVLFDCIEFNDHFRQLDVLSELAFLCMDLDVLGAAHLANHFLETYQEKHRVIMNKMDRALFRYFKMYRANVRLKVYTLKAGTGDKQESEVKIYLELLGRYLQKLPRS